MSEKQIKTRILAGTVKSDRMNKTVVVKVNRLRMHPKYKKYYKVSSSFKAHDEENKYKAGDRVRIKATRPLSKDKQWIVDGYELGYSPVSEQVPDVAE